MPTVTVLLPYRDAAPTLDEAIDSIRAQRRADFELLLVDDGSRDQGPTIARRHARDDARLRLVTTGGVGLPAALALGLAEARAELVARMDADDVAHPERLRIQIAAMARAPKVAALGTLVEGFTTSGWPLGDGMLAYIAWLNELVTPEEHARDLFVESPLCHPSVMLRKSAVVSVGGYRDVAWAEDYDLWLRLEAAGFGLAKVPETLHKWRHHGGRATFRDPRYALPRFVEAKVHYLAPRLRAMDRPLVAWGAGPTSKRFVRALEGEGLRFTAFFDIDPRKVGRTARGVPIFGPADLGAQAAAHPRPFFVAAVGSRGARSIVRARFLAHGFEEVRDFVCVA